MNHRKRILNLSMTILVSGYLSIVPAIAGDVNPPSAQGQQTARKEITRERAIEIARERIDFKPKSVRAVKAIEDKRKVWRVTFRGEPISKVHAMGEIMIVSVDRFTS